MEINITGIEREGNTQSYQENVNKDELRNGPFPHSLTCSEQGQACQRKAAEETEVEGSEVSKGPPLLISKQITFGNLSQIAQFFKSFRKFF